jgi:7-cyano-7-deazaguanine reductase
MTERRPGQYGIDEIAANRLRAWPNQHPKRDYIVRCEIPEFTCLCPRSGFPDFATIILTYIPDQDTIELQSLKLYINGYRNRKISHEAAVNTICDDLVEMIDPRWIEVVGDFGVRGNIKTLVFAEHRQPGFTGETPAYQRYY